MKFEKAYDSYKKYMELRLKKQSIRIVRNRIENQILPHFKEKDIFKISEIEYLNWQIEIEKKNFSYAYKKSLHFAFVSFFNYCIIYFNLNKNIASKVGNFKEKYNCKKEMKFFNIEEFKQFIKYVDNNIYKQFFNFMFFTGARPGETMALRFSDLNNSIISINKTISKELDSKTKERIINLPKTKTSIRKIEIDKKLNKDILELKKYYELKYSNKKCDYFVFGGLKPLAPTTITRIKNKACRKANLKQIRLHDFRHSHATLLVENNMMINEISRRLGHSNVSITLNTYVHTDREQEKRVINTLNSLRQY